MATIYSDEEDARIQTITTDSIWLGLTKTESYWHYLDTTIVIDLSYGKTAFEKFDANYPDSSHHCVYIQTSRKWRSTAACAEQKLCVCETRCTLLATVT
jgi:hypothetical protein